MDRQMNHPPVVELEKKVGCRYVLVTTIAKRARQILVSKPSPDIKPVAQAVDELNEDKLDIKYPSEYYQTTEV